jgi:hypothetical protein
VLERDEYRIEKVIFESRPGFLVASNLYIPKHRKFPLPGVVGTCGHSTFGKSVAIYSFMLDAPYVGQKTRDVLQVVAWLESFGIREIHLVAKGWGALPATFAALLADSVVKVTLKNALTAYSDIATSRDYTCPLSAFLPGVLREFDLPDCYRALAAKQLRLIEPWNAKGQTAKV